MIFLLLLEYFWLPNRLEQKLDFFLFMGELSLEGKLRRTSGALSQAILAKEKKLTSFFLPHQNAKEAAIIKGIDILPVSSLHELLNHLAGASLIKKQKSTSMDAISHEDFEFDMKDIKGQEQAKRALEISAAGG